MRAGAEPKTDTEQLSELGCSTAGSVLCSANGELDR